MNTIPVSGFRRKCCMSVFERLMRQCIFICYYLFKGMWPEAQMRVTRLIWLQGVNAREKKQNGVLPCMPYSSYSVLFVKLIFESIVIWSVDNYCFKKASSSPNGAITKQRAIYSLMKRRKGCMPGCPQAFHKGKKTPNITVLFPVFVTGILCARYPAGLTRLRALRCM